MTYDATWCQHLTSMNLWTICWNVLRIATSYWLVMAVSASVNSFIVTSKVESISAVRMKPGFIWQTRMFHGANSSWRHLPRPSTACFEAQYTPMKEAAENPAALEILMIRLPLDSFSSGSNAYSDATEYGHEYDNSIMSSIIRINQSTLSYSYYRITCITSKSPK